MQAALGQDQPIVFAPVLCYQQALRRISHFVCLWDCTNRVCKSMSTSQGIWLIHVLEEVNAQINVLCYIIDVLHSFRGLSFFECTLQYSATFGTHIQGMQSGSTFHAILATTTGFVDAAEGQLDPGTGV